MEFLTTTLPAMSLVMLAVLRTILALATMIKKGGASTRASEAPLPPGPWKLPLIGSMHHLATGELPHHALARLAREHGPVMHLQMGQVGLVVVSSREAAAEVLKAQDANFAHRPELTAPKALAYGCAEIAFSSGAYWRRVRRICVVELLGAKRVRSFEPVRMEETRALLDGVVAQAPAGAAVDLRTVLAPLNSAVVCRTAFGKTFEHRSKLMQEGLELTSGFFFSDFFPSLKFLNFPMKLRLRRVHRQVDGVLGDIIAERQQLRREKGKETAAEDMLDVLLDAAERTDDREMPITHESAWTRAEPSQVWLEHAESSPPPSRNQAQLEVLPKPKRQFGSSFWQDMFVAGTEPSSTTIEWALAELMKNPAEMAKVQEEVRTSMAGKTTTLRGSDVAKLSYLKLVVRETLRLHLPSPLLVPRVCERRCRLLGHTIPAGSRVVVNVWGIARDQRYWGEDAETFRPARFLAGGSVDSSYNGGGCFELLPFGGGRRVCPGIEFGLAVIELCLACLLFHFDWKLPGGMEPEDLDMSEASVGLGAIRKEPLRLVPVIHVPLDPEN